MIKISFLVKGKQIIRDEKGEPILFEGKEFTFCEFKKNLGRMDKPWLDYMNSIIERFKAGKLYNEN